MFWDNVEKCRQEKEFTYRQIARLLDMAETTVSSMRHYGTEPRVSDALKIADFNTVVIKELTKKENSASIKL